MSEPHGGCYDCGGGEAETLLSALVEVEKEKNGVKYLVRESVALCSECRGKRGIENG